MTENLRYERDGAVARVTLDRPGKLNPLDIETLDGVLDALDRVREEDRIRVLTVRGAGGNFSAGADLSLFREAVEAGDRATVETLIGRLHAVMDGLEALPVATLAVVEGVAFAGGLELLLACDLRLAAEDARIADQHANYGLVAGAGGTQRLQRQLPAALANDLLYTGRWLSGSEATEWGLVSRAFPAEEFEAELAAVESELGEKSRTAASETKHLQRVGAGTDKRTALELEREAVVDHYFSDDAREGFAAFAEDRDPEFE